MFGRSIRIAPALLTCVLVLVAHAGGSDGAEAGSATAGPADIELRKTFRFARRASRLVSGSDKRGGPGVPGDSTGNSPPQLGAVAEALGEELQSSGTLHLPDVGGGDVVLRGSVTPILQTASGRHLIIDRDRTIDPGVVDGLSRRWPGFAVVQPPAGAHLRDVIGSVLDAAGYHEVLRSAPLIFGRGISIRVAPDFVLLRSEGDILSGETRALSVVDPADALPPELRELAGEHRVRIFELTPGGLPAGPIPPPWRDPVGRVTTMEAPRLAPIIGEIAAACGLPAERPAPAPPIPGEKGVGADPTATIGALLERSGVPAIGPVVEFFREPSPGSPRRFVISAPGWLAESGGRRLLITGAAVPPLVRLFLTREGIDLFEYRIR